MYYDPAKQIEFEEKRKVGCFSCIQSKYGIVGELKTKRGYCEMIEAGLLKADYPNENKDTCKEYICKFQAQVNKSQKR